MQGEKLVCSNAVPAYKKCPVVCVSTHAEDNYIFIKRF